MRKENSSVTSRALMPSTGEIISKLFDVITDDSPPALKQARAELEGLQAAGKQLDQLLEAEELYGQIQAIRRDNLRKIESIKAARNPAVVAYARERGWLPQPLPDDAVRIINQNTSITDGYMDPDGAEW